MCWFLLDVSLDFHYTDEASLKKVKYFTLYKERHKWRDKREDRKKKKEENIITIMIIINIIIIFITIIVIIIIN